MFAYSFPGQKYAVSPEIKAMRQFKIKLIIECSKQQRRI
jgi:hypothetical protein